MLATPTPTPLLPYALLYLGVLGLLLSSTSRAWPWLLGASLLAGLATGILAPAALFPLAALAIACYALGWDWPRIGRIGRWGALIAVVMLSLALGLHAFPGFQNLLIAQDLRLSPDAAPFTLYWNYDKAFCGLLLLALCVGVAAPRANRRRAARAVLVITAGLIAVVMPLGLVLDYVRFDAKLPGLLIWWVPANLLITSVSEEAFFRGLIQYRLSMWLGPRLRWGNAAAIAIAATLFGLAHFAGGAIYVFLAFVAGLGYGLAYHVTGRIEASILTHFLLNLTHLTLFTYPRLAQLDPRAVAVY